MDDDIDEKIQDAVEQKVEERLEEERDRIKEEVRDELLREDAESSPKKEEEGIDEGQSYSRRSFLKALGLGAGGLALSSAASADLVPFRGRGGAQSL